MARYAMAVRELNLINRSKLIEILLSRKLPSDVKVSDVTREVLTEYDSLYDTNDPVSKKKTEHLELRMQYYQKYLMEEKTNQEILRQQNLISELQKIIKCLEMTISQQTAVIELLSDNNNGVNKEDVAEHPLISSNIKKTSSEHKETGDDKHNVQGPVEKSGNTLSDNGQKGHTQTYVIPMKRKQTPIESKSLYVEKHSTIPTDQIGCNMRKNEEETIFTDSKLLDVEKHSTIPSDQIECKRRNNEEEMISTESKSSNVGKHSTIPADQIECKWRKNKVETISTECISLDVGKHSMIPADQIECKWRKNKEEMISTESKLLDFGKHSFIPADQIECKWRKNKEETISVESKSLDVGKHSTIPADQIEYKRRENKEETISTESKLLDVEKNSTISTDQTVCNTHKNKEQTISTETNIPKQNEQNHVCKMNETPRKFWLYLGGIAESTSEEQISAYITKLGVNNGIVVRKLKTLGTSSVFSLSVPNAEDYKTLNDKGFLPIGAHIIRQAKKDAPGK